MFYNFVYRFTDIFSEDRRQVRE